MDFTKKVVLKTMDGVDVTFVLRTQVSEWDQDQVEAVYRPHFVVTQEKDAKTGETKNIYNIPPEKTADLYKEATDVKFGLFIKEAVGLEKSTPEDIRKNFSRPEFQKLTSVVEEIYNDSILSAEKKSTSPESSSQPSQTASNPISQPNSQTSTSQSGQAGTSTP